MAKTKYYNKDTQKWEYAETGCIPVRGTHYWIAQDLKPLHDYISNRVMATAEVCFLTVSVTSNQPDKSVLEGLMLSVTLPDGRAAEMAAGSVIAFTEGSVTVQFPEVTGYRKPDNVSVSYAKGSVTQQVTYLAEEVTVNALVDGTASSDYTYEVSGDGIVCLTGSGTSFTGVTKWLVPHGVTMTVTPSSVDGYTTSAVTHTASGVTGSVSVEWSEIRLGVFIEDTTGKLWAIDGWDGSATFNSVAVINETHSFGIAKEHLAACNFSPMTHVGFGTFNGVTYNRTGYTSITAAYSDMNGEGNTDLIISSQGSGSTYVAQKCKAYSFANGKNGYLMAAGEYKMIVDNITEINSAMTKVGGSEVNVNVKSSSIVGMWTSTLCSSYVTYSTSGLNGDVSSFDIDEGTFADGYQGLRTIVSTTGGTTYLGGLNSSFSSKLLHSGSWDSEAVTGEGIRTDSVDSKIGARPLCRLMSNP